MPLRIASYNIAHGRGVAKSNWEGGDRAKRLDRLDQIADLLRSIDADIVVLNEVDFDSSWSYSVNQAKYLAERAGYPFWVEQRNLDFRILIWKWRFGNAVLSKFPITNAQIVDLPSYSTWEVVLAGKKRGVVCEIKAAGQAIRVIGTHLSHRQELLRVNSANVLVDLASHGKLPTIIAGDLNSTPPTFPKSFSDPNNNNAIDTLDRSRLFKRLPHDRQPTEQDLTFHSRQPHCVIDWVMIPEDWYFWKYRVVLSELSDHRPVYTEIAPTVPDR
jgi:endonuclease/exonuclease/phosphatase family metal-dependent hydrolase